jgi:hypothetical protein
MFGKDTIEVKLKKEVLKVKDENLERVCKELENNNLIQRFSVVRGFNFVHEKDKIINERNKIEHRYYVEVTNFVTVYYYETVPNLA